MLVTPWITFLLLSLKLERTKNRIIDIGCSYLPGYDADAGECYRREASPKFIGENRIMRLTDSVKRIRTTCSYMHSIYVNGETKVILKSQNKLLIFICKSVEDNSCRDEFFPAYKLEI